MLGEAGIQVSQVIDLEDDTVLIVEKAEKELEIQEAVKKMGGVASLLRMQRARLAHLRAIGRAKHNGAKTKRRAKALPLPCRFIRHIYKYRPEYIL